MIFLKHFEGKCLYLGFLKKPPSKNKAKVYCPWLPNIYGGLKACLNQKWIKEKELKEAVDKFWSTEFVYDDPLWFPGNVELRGIERLNKVFLKNKKANIIDRFHAWEKLSLDQVIKRMKGGPHVKFDHLADKVFKNVCI
jgi:hypothetical protein